MTDDLVKRVLSKKAARHTQVIELCDRIEALTAENERLRGLFAALAIDPDACAVARQYARAALAEPRA